MAQSSVIPQTYPLLICKLENGPVEMVDLPIDSMLDLSIFTH